LFSGTGLVPVGQVNTLQHLTSLGMEFEYQIDLSYDLVIEEHDRMLGIFNTIDAITNTPLDRLHREMEDSAYHNIDHIVNGDFSKFCRSMNDSKRHIIEEWIKM
jgi:hypothetical protein